MPAKVHLLESDLSVWVEKQENTCTIAGISHFSSDFVEKNCIIAGFLCFRVASPLMRRSRACRLLAVSPPTSHGSRFMAHSRILILLPANRVRASHRTALVLQLSRHLHNATTHRTSMAAMKLGAFPAYSQSVIINGIRNTVRLLKHRRC